MQNDRHDDMEHLQEAMDAAARELDASRAEALEAIDRAPFSCVARPLPSSACDHVRSWFHLKVCLVAATGFFTDA